MGSYSLGDSVSTVESTSILVDQYIRKRAERLKSAQETERLDAEEKALKKQLIEIAIAGKAKTLGGSVGAVNYSRTDKPKVEDWDKFYAYIAQFGAWELLQKRIGEKAVEERWEDGIAIPGVVTFPVDNLTIVGAKK